MRRRELAGAGFLAALAARRARAALPERVLIVATSTGATGPGGRLTGLDLLAFAEVYWRLREAELAVDLATIRGGPPPIDPATGSMAGLPMALRMDPDALRSFARPPAVAAMAPASYAGLLLADGRGALWDFPPSGDLGRLLAATLAAGRPVAAVGHGVAGLLAPAPDAPPLAAGRRVTGPPDAEERALGWEGRVPLSLEERLRAAGAVYVADGIFLEHVVRDGGLITAQNGGSALPAVRALIEAMRAAPGAPA